MKLLILSIGRDIVSSAERQLGRSADAVVRAGDIKPEQYSEIRREVYEWLRNWQGDTIQLVLSGPLALAFTLGQLAGLNHFDLQIFHYDSEQRTYLEVPMPTRQEIL
ncbi:MAG: SAVED domain-containing protein [SAR324 cluster bacterium]|nr:SAVED domain-containing protein [SAR324 cluster bacterium]